MSVFPTFKTTLKAETAVSNVTTKSGVKNVTHDLLVHIFVLSYKTQRAAVCGQLTSKYCLISEMQIVQNNFHGLLKPAINHNAGPFQTKHLQLFSCHILLVLLKIW